MRPVDLAALAADILAVDWIGLGGIHLVARAGPSRDRWLAALAARLPRGVPLRKIPATVGADRLVGGLDLSETLRCGVPVRERGILGGLDGGLALLAMAERQPPETTAIIASALDTGAVAVERDGFAARIPARFGAVALDEGIGEGEGLGAALRDRLALHLDLNDPAIGAADAPPADPARLASARRRLPTIAVSDEITEAVASLAFAFGIASLRAPLHALCVARVLAALAGRDAVSEADVGLATRLVLLPRATQIPDRALPEDAPADTEPPDEAAPEANDGAPEPPSDREMAERDTPPAPSDAEQLVEAVLSALPRGLLDALDRAVGRAAAAASRGTGATQASGLRGRPTGTRSGRPRERTRLALVDTLRAAAPWQPIRRAGAPPTLGPTRLIVRPEDFRIRRYKDRRESVTIFLVDASGSMAAARLAEAKGAIGRMFAESYSRRANVALIAFRGAEAETIVPPTRSLTRANRLLGGLPGGGGTPLAAGLEAARLVCDEVTRKGRTPSVVILSDGRANVGRDGTPGRARAHEDAVAAARTLRAHGIGALFVDTARRPGEEAHAIAEAAAARYLWLPDMRDWHPLQGGDDPRSSAGQRVQPR